VTSWSWCYELLPVQQWACQYQARLRFLLRPSPMSITLKFTWKGSLSREQCPVLLCSYIALICALSKLPTPSTDCCTSYIFVLFSSPSTNSVVVPHVLCGFCPQLADCHQSLVSSTSTGSILEANPFVQYANLSPINITGISWKLSKGIQNAGPLEVPDGWGGW